MKKLIRTTRNSGRVLFLLVITICYLITAKVGEIKVCFFMPILFYCCSTQWLNRQRALIVLDIYIFMAHVLDESYISFGARLKESFSLVSGCGCSSYTNIVIILLGHSLKYI